MKNKKIGLWLLPGTQNSFNFVTFNYLKSKTRNFYLQRTTSLEIQDRFKNNFYGKWYLCQKTPFTEALIDHNLKAISKQFSKRSLVITLYIMTRYYKVEKNEEINKKYTEYIEILKNNYEKIDDPRSLMAILFNLYKYHLMVPENLVLQIFAHSLKLYKSSTTFLKDDGKRFAGFITNYIKYEPKFAFDKWYIEQIFDFFYENWKFFRIDNILLFLSNLATSKFAPEIFDRLIKTLDLIDFYHKYFTMEDLFIVLSYFQILSHIANKKNYGNLEEFYKRIYEITNKSIEKTLEKVKYEDEETKNENKGKYISYPKEYYFENKSILLKNLLKIKEIEKLIKSEKLSENYISHFQMKRITFTKQKEKKEAIHYLNELNLQEDNNFLKLLDLMFPK